MTQANSEHIKHLRLTLDFTVSINTNGIPDDSDQYDYNERQKRLLSALLANEEGLRAFLSHRIAEHLEIMAWDQWDSLLTSGLNLSEILESSIATLDESDQRHFHRAMENRYFYESIEQIVGCVVTKLEKAKIEEVGDESEHH